MHVLGRDPRRIPLRAERTEQLTAENIRAAMLKYISAERYTVVTLTPEAPAGPGAVPR
jgi:predicted Zn-dependent peptidase